MSEPQNNTPPEPESVGNDSRSATTASPGKFHACREHYRRALESVSTIVSASTEHTQLDGLSKCHSFIADLATWTEELTSRQESQLLSAAAREYQYSLLLLVSGFYRQAFSSIRLSLELALNTAYLSANELHLRQWMAGARDLAWASIVDQESGLFSKPFARAFFPELEQESAHMCSLAAATYRECSTYVHGNASTQKLTPTALTFSAELHAAWLDTASRFRLLTSFGLALRYLKDAPARMKDRLDACLTDELGHLSAVRLVLDDREKNG